MFKLAYLTDPHLAPLPEPSCRELASKRLLGYLNWRLFRNKIHDRSVLEALVDDIHGQSPNHIAVGGDIANLSLAREFSQGLQWLQTLGSPEQVSLVPGNHDAYVSLSWDKGMGLWRDYMSSDADGTPGPGQNKTFPWVRVRGPIALTGLSSAVPKPPGFASGEVGEAQLDALRSILRRLKRADKFRVVMVHHPPLVAMSDPRRGLDDAELLQETLRVEGAELILFGHRHFHSVDELIAEDSTIPVVGAPSASSVKFLPGFLARYALFHISRKNKRWTCDLVWRGLKEPGGPIVEIDRAPLMG